MFGQKYQQMLANIVLKHGHQLPMLVSNIVNELIVCDVQSITLADTLRRKHQCQRPVLSIIAHLCF